MTSLIAGGTCSQQALSVVAAPAIEPSVAPQATPTAQRRPALMLSLPSAAFNQADACRPMTYAGHGSPWHAGTLVSPMSGGAYPPMSPASAVCTPANAATTTWRTFVCPMAPQRRVHRMLTESTPTANSSGSSVGMLTPANLWPSNASTPVQSMVPTPRSSLRPAQSCWVHVNDECSPAALLAPSPQNAAPSPVSERAASAEPRSSDPGGDMFLAVDATTPSPSAKRGRLDGTPTPPPKPAFMRRAALDEAFLQ